jgi:hypothetical protein
MELRKEVQQELERLTRFLPKEQLLERLSLPTELLPEIIQHVVPSIVLGNDGLALARLLLVTDNYLSEVHIAGMQARTQFDFVAKRTVVNYRFSVWTHDVKEGEAVKVSYEVALIELMHDAAGPFRTELAYAGSERALWLKQVLGAIPIELIVGGKKAG